MYQYKLTSTGSNSGKLGNCEVCNKVVSEVFNQIESRTYSFIDAKGINHTGNTLNNCHSLFGHRECLEALQIKG